MITCPICNKELEDDALFCDSCGAKMITEPAPVFCPSCGKSLESSAPFCTSCGADLAPKSSSHAPKKEKPPFPIKPVVAGIAAILAIVLVYNLIGWIFCGGQKDVTSIAYFKDNEIYLVDAGDVDEPWQVSEKLFADEVFGSGDVSEYTKMSTDGKKIFFPDKVSAYDSGGFTLYWRDATDPDSVAEKVASDVTNYGISDSGNMVIYSNGDDWYWHDLERKEKIGSDCRILASTDDFETVYYKGKNDITYRKVFGGDEKFKIDSDIASIEFISDDGETVYYLKDADDYSQSLYVKEGEDDKKKIADNVEDVIEIYESGEIYYIKSNNTDDDYSYGAPKTLFYYDGETSANLSDEFSLLCVHSTEKPVLIFRADADEKTDEENDRVIVDASYFHVEEGVCTELDIESVYNYSICLSEDCETLYYISGVTESYGDGDLHKATISDGKIEEDEVYDSDISTLAPFYLIDDKIVYGKNYNDDSDTYELFVDKESVSDDVRGIIYYDEAEITLVVTDYSREKTTGTLSVLDGTDIEKIYDDVYCGSNGLVVLDSGEIFFLADYNSDMNYGDLYFYDGGDAELVDDEVAFLVSLNHVNKD